MPESIVDQAGRSVNAVYGYAYFLCQLLERCQPTHIAAAFDESLNSSFRNKIYPAYKANRESAPDDLKYQFMLCRKLTDLMGVKSYASKRYEADDLIGSIARRLSRYRYNATIVSSDKDLSQLIGKGDVFWNFARDKVYSYDECQNAFGIKPEQMIDYLALAGDSVDNIPGVTGIGSKTAVALLDKYHSLQNIYNQLEEIKRSQLRGAKRLVTLLSSQKEQALISQQLATIAVDAPIKMRVKDLVYTPPSSSRIHRFCTKHGLGMKLRQRLLNFVSK